jgi:glucan 1,3-beta-glucosidase
MRRIALAAALAVASAASATAPASLAPVRAVPPANASCATW